MKWQTIAPQQNALTLAPIYNLFRRKLTPDLGCAVPEYCPVPAFLEGSTWEYAGTVRQDDVPPPGFDLTAAECSVHLNGFHLFQSVGRVAPGSPIKLGQSYAVVQVSACWLRERLASSHRPARHLVCPSSPDQSPERLTDHRDFGGGL